MLKGSTEKAKFAEYWNNLFDAFNRNLPCQGLKLDDLQGFQVKHLTVYFLNYHLKCNK